MGPPEEDETKLKALRYNNEKPKWSLVHFGSFIPMVKVLMFGAKKYSPDNWKKPMDKKELLDSMQRHMAALMDGEELDPESGESHIGHLMCNTMFFSYHFVIPNKTIIDLTKFQELEKKFL